MYKVIIAESLSLHHPLVTVEGKLHQAYHVTYNDGTQEIEYRLVKENNTVKLFEHDKFMQSAKAYPTS